MNYAETYHIGNNHYTRTKTAKTTASTIGRVRKLDAKTKRCKSGAKGQTAGSANSNVTDGILKCRFLPKLKTTQTVEPCQKTERDFYKSLSNLATHYRIEPMQTRQDYGYPYNIVLAMWDLDTQLKRTNINWDGFKLIQDSKRTFFTSEERYNTGTNLYYIPVVPLYKMLRDKQRKQTAQLLLSVCSYLYHIANIPYYRQENSYLFWLYEMHKDWIEQDEDAEETELHNRELRNAEYMGNNIEQKLFNPCNLQFFEKRLNQFKSRDIFDNECRQIACNAYALYTEYPNTSIFRNAPIAEENPINDEYDSEVITMHKYISFVADTRGWLYESIAECINNEFNECGIIEEPSISKTFDGSEITAGTLDFENRLFDLLDDLFYVLHNFKTIAK